MTTPERRKIYHARQALKHKQNPASKKCDCGNPAALKKNNAYICERCCKIEEMRLG